MSPRRLTVVQLLPALHGGVTGSFLEITALMQLAWDQVLARMERGDEAEVQRSIDQVLLLHSLIMSFGGIPLIYYGDELGTLNNEDFLKDAEKARDSRWIHRPSGGEFHRLRARYISVSGAKR